MPPLPANRAARRKAAKGKAAPDLAAIRARVLRAKPSGLVAGRTDRARRLLLSWLDTATAHGTTPAAIVGAMSDGTAAGAVGQALAANAAADPPAILREAACRSGCAFCCILDGPDGGTITEAEARALHAALAPLAGRPDGRQWHPSACPALDPDSRTCRAYAARPALCRAFVSRDAAACAQNAAGGAAEGAGLLGHHLDMLAVHALARAALKGLARAPTHDLRRLAAAAVAGDDMRASLAASRHPPGTLDRTASGAAAAAK